MVDLSRDASGNVHARLLDLVSCRSGRADKDWLQARGADFTSRVKIATLDPFHGYKNAIDDELEDAVAVLDAFLPRKREVPPVVKLGTKAVDDVRRRIQTEIHGHRGRKGDQLYRIRTTLHAGEENLTERQRERLASVWESDERHVAVEVAWRCSQQLRSAYHQPTHASGRVIAQQIIDTFHTCPIPEVARLGRTLRQWRKAFLGYFDTGGAGRWRHPHSANTSFGLRRG
jgi:transposase